MKKTIFMGLSLLALLSGCNNYSNTHAFDADTQARMARNLSENEAHH